MPKCFFLQENAEADVYHVRRPGGKNRTKCGSSTTIVAGSLASSNIVSLTRQMGFTDVVRGTLRRRVSTSLLKHKLKKFQVSKTRFVLCINLCYLDFKRYLE